MNQDHEKLSLILNRIAKRTDFVVWKVRKAKLTATFQLGTQKEKRTFWIELELQGTKDIIIN